MGKTVEEERYLIQAKIAGNRCKAKPRVAVMFWNPVRVHADALYPRRIKHLPNGLLAVYVSIPADTPTSCGVYLLLSEDRAILWMIWSEVAPITRVRGGNGPHRVIDCNVKITPLIFGRILPKIKIYTILHPLQNTSCPHILKHHLKGIHVLRS